MIMCIEVYVKRAMAEISKDLQEVMGVLYLATTGLMTSHTAFQVITFSVDNMN